MPLGVEEVETCWAVDTPVLYTLHAFGKVKSGKPEADGRNELLMMSEIYQRGPIVCSISTPDEFTYSCAPGHSVAPMLEAPHPFFLEERWKDASKPVMSFSVYHSGPPSYAASSSGRVFLLVPPPPSGSTVL